jgi:hypothetical protein
MSSKTCKTTVVCDGSMCFIPLPFDPKNVFGKVRAPVKVTLNGYTYRSTIAAMGGPPCIPLRKSNREAAGLEGGETIDVRLELDTEKRQVTPPADFVKGAQGRFTCVGAVAGTELHASARACGGDRGSEEARDPRAPHRSRGSNAPRRAAAEAVAGRRRGEGAEINRARIGAARWRRSPASAAYSSAPPIPMPSDGGTKAPGGDTHADGLRAGSLAPRGGPDGIRAVPGRHVVLWRLEPSVDGQLPRSESRRDGGATPRVRRRGHGRSGELPERAFCAPVRSRWQPGGTVGASRPGCSRGPVAGDLNGPAPVRRHHGTRCEPATLGRRTKQLFGAKGPIACPGAAAAGPAAALEVPVMRAPLHLSSLRSVALAKDMHNLCRERAAGPPQTAQTTDER